MLTVRPPPTEPVTTHVVRPGLPVRAAWWFGARRRRLARALPPPWHAILCAISGVLMAFAFPPFDWGWLGWLALLPVYVALRDLRPAQGLTAGLIAGLVYFGILLKYIAMFGAVPWLALVVYQAGFFAIFGFLGAVMWKCPLAWVRVPALGAAWTVNELLRGNAGALAFTFGHLGYSQHKILWTLQLASLVGHYGLGLAMAMFQAAVVEAMPRIEPGSRPATGGPFVVLSALLLVAITWGAIRVGTHGHVDERRLDVVAVQGNIPGDMSGLDPITHCPDVYIARSLTDARGADLVVWPETAIPYHLINYPEQLRRVRDLTRTLDAHALIGTFETSADGGIYNAAWVLDPEGEIVAKYYKRRLVIFGEYIPYRDRLGKFLSHWPIRHYDFTPGTRDLVVPVRSVRLAPMICFESVFPEISRRLVSQGAEVLVMITSDAWVEDNPGEIRQHSQCSTLRAVETGRWLIRAAGTGVTAVIAPTGELVSEAPLLQEASVRATISGDTRLTLYQATGLWPLVLVVCLLSLGGLADLFSHRPAGEDQ